MKISTVLLAGLTGTAFAAPSAWGQDYKYDGKYDAKKYDNKYDSKKYDVGKKCMNGPFEFTSTYSIMATPDQVYNGTAFTGGLEGCSGQYELGLNSEKNLICYYITITSFRGEYQSAAKTATHLHEAARGASGPPRIAFPNPVPVSDTERVSVGCMMGPFETGIIGSDGMDTGAAFNVKQIEQNPAGFFVDVHSSLAVPGAVRGQIA